ncbi:Hypothetical predicted protein [Octopus vulgaris]|uniref:Uncharacterized protein n=1 Tax=Octopus vulgaris TaxID=6645 RepID=A0AA36AM06_OCTVU|nr:Hypothetical predicted protein [Octopus vulgaris]
MHGRAAEDLGNDDKERPLRTLRFASASKNSIDKTVCDLSRTCIILTAFSVLFQQLNICSSSANAAVDIQKDKMLKSSANIEQLILFFSFNSCLTLQYHCLYH